MGFGYGATSTVDAWQAGDVHYVAGNVKVNETSGATFNITGVQLEVGDTATPFEHRSYGDELARCQRYYYRTKVSTYGQGTFYGYTLAGQSLGTVFTFPSEMRTSPTRSYGGSWTASNFGTTPLLQGDAQSCFVYQNAISTGSGYFVPLGSGYLTFDAEL